MSQAASPGLGPAVAEAVAEVGGRLGNDYGISNLNNTASQRDQERLSYSPEVTKELQNSSACPGESTVMGAGEGA